LAVVVVNDAADPGAGRDWLEPHPRPAELSSGAALLVALDARGSEVAVGVGDADVALSVVGVVEVPGFTW
jgi:hypothetical protein